MDGVCRVGFGKVQPLRDYGEQRHALPVRGILREPPADAGLAVLQAGIPSRPAAGQIGPAGAPVLFPKFWLQPREWLYEDHGRDVTWHQPREPLISPAPTVGSEGPQSPSGAGTPNYVHIQPTPAATTAPAAASVPVSDNAAPPPLRNPAPAAAPVPLSDTAARAATKPDRLNP